MDLLNTPHGFAIIAPDGGPPQLVCAVVGGLSGFHQMFQVTFVILFTLVALIANAHQLLADDRIYLQVNHFVRGWDTHEIEFKVEQPVDVAVPIFSGQFGALMDSIGGSISVRNDNAAPS